jgi:hypothetical protein
MITLEPVGQMLPHGALNRHLLTLDWPDDEPKGGSVVPRAATEPSAADIRSCVSTAGGMPGTRRWTSLNAPPVSVWQQVRVALTRFRGHRIVHTSEEVSGVKKASHYR